MAPNANPKPEVLVHLRRVDAMTPAVSIGLALAQRLQAWATGLHVVPVGTAAFASPEAVALYANEADGLYQSALKRDAAWQAHLAAHGIEGEWQVAQGDTVEALCHASRWSDFVVVDRPQLSPDAPTGWGIVSRTVFGASAPVIVVPERAAATAVGEHVVIAWNHSREATLAVRGALPLLARAGRISVLEGDIIDNPFGLRYLPRFDLRGWLQRHSIDAAFRAFDGGKQRGAALLDATHELGGDLIVIGAWGHSRITELVLGGTTRHLFQYSDLPLLVAH